MNTEKLLFFYQETITKKERLQLFRGFSRHTNNAIETHYYQYYSIFFTAIMLLDHYIVNVAHRKVWLNAQYMGRVEGSQTRVTVVNIFFFT